MLARILSRPFVFPRRRWTDEAVAQLKALMDRTIADKDQAIADIKALMTQRIADKDQAIADIKALMTQTIAAKDEAAAELRERNLSLVQGKASLEAEVSAARGTLSRRAAYEMVLHVVHVASKLHKAATPHALSSKFNATATETWLFQNASELSKCDVPALNAAAGCVMQHLWDHESGKVQSVSLYAPLSNMIHGTGLDMTSIKAKPADSAITDSMHNLFVCLLRKVLNL
jgi:hypothetical protein